MGAAGRNPKFRGHAVLTLSFALSLLLLVSTRMLAQTAGHAPESIDRSQMRNQPSVTIRITVLDAQNAPLGRRALIKFHGVSQDTTSWQITGEESQTLFVDRPLGRYDVEASAVGYISSRTTLNVASMADTLDVKLMLQRDASAKMESDASLPPRTLHEMNRAIQALRSDDLKEAQKRLEQAERTSPSSARVKYLFGYLFFVKDDLAQAQTSLEQATTLNPQYRPAWSLLGRLHLVAGRPQQAITALEQAVTADPEDWVAHDLLADAYLQQHEYQKAREQAELAIDTGKQDGTVAQLALGEALANLGKGREAITALKIFLNSHPTSIAVPHAEELLRKLEQYQSKPNETWSEFERQVAAFDIANDLVISPKTDLPAITWLPADIDRSKQAVVAGLTCPAQEVIEGASSHVQELMANVEKTVAIESILYERLDQAGNATVSETRKFDYTTAVSQKPDVVLVDEYRSQRYDQTSLPDHIADNGFAVVALVFHPIMRDAFKMECEGLGEWLGKPTWLVRFQQREDRPSHMQAYRLGDVAYPVSLKGRAWIAADNFQIVRVESDMLKPMPAIELLAEHTVTEYAPIPFRKSGFELWLPQTAEVYLYFRGQRYYHKHMFDKYMVFLVNAEDKVHEAKRDPEVPKPERDNASSGQLERIARD